MDLRKPLILLCFLGPACDGGGGSQPDATPAHDAAEWTPTDPTTQPHPGGEPLVVEGRRARRITVDQLRRSLPDLFGDQTWTLRQRGGEPLDLLDALSRTLGEPDYIEVTEASSEPTPLFHKFMEDMGIQLCTKAVTSDAAAPDPQSRFIARWPEDVDRTLRFLRLKFHGLYVPEDTPPAEDGLGDYRTLYETIRADADENGAWIGVCVAFFTAPEFMAW